MEFALRTKIDELLKTVEKSKEVELKLKNQTIENIERFKDEDKICDELENKLAQLELVLRTAETENEVLKKTLADTEARYDFCRCG